MMYTINNLKKTLKELLGFFCFLLFLIISTVCYADFGTGWSPTGRAGVDEYVEGVEGKYYITTLLYNPVTKNSQDTWFATVYCNGAQHGKLRNGGDWVSCPLGYSMEIVAPKFVVRNGQVPQGDIKIFSVESKGEKGEQGPVGAKGLRGEKGDRGPRGEKGEPGQSVDICTFDEKIYGVITSR